MLPPEKGSGILFPSDNRALAHLGIYIWQQALFLSLHFLQALFAED